MTALAFAAISALVTPGPRGEPSPPPPPGIEVEVRCVDDSTLKARLLDETLELETKYGTLRIAVADVRRIEFATRVPPADADRIAAAVAGLAGSDFKSRERATAELKAFRARAYPAVLKATSHTDPEVVARAKAVLDHIRDHVPAGLLETRALDVVTTDDSTIAGTLTAATLRVRTLAFGEQPLKLADVRTLGAAGTVGDAAHAPHGPANLMTYANQFGKELVFRVTGTAPAGQWGGGGFGGRGGMAAQPGGVWGTDVYTLDSDLAQAAVHAGALQPGQTGVVRVRIVQSPGQFTGSARHGVASNPFQGFPAGAYEFIRR